MQSRVKRPHFVPRSYLGGFTDLPDRIWIYDKLEKNIRQQSIKDVAVVKDLYLNTKQVSPLDIVEVTALEGKAKRIIKNLEERKLPNPAELGHLLNFVALQFLRTPAAGVRAHLAFAEFVSGLRKEYRRRKDIGRSTEGLEKIATDLLKDFKSPSNPIEFLSVDENSTPPIDHFVDTIVGEGYFITTILAKQNWTFLYSRPKSVFITSDDPFCVFDQNDSENLRLIPLSPDTTKIIPLSKG